MTSQERKLEHGLRIMLDILTGYLGNNATRGEWLTEIQRRFAGRNGKLRRGWSNDSIDRKIHKLEAMGLIAGGRGFGAYWSATATAQTSLLGFASDADALVAASVRKLTADDSFVDVLAAA